MNTLVIVAHPDLSTSTINAAWVAALRASGQVTVHVLYEEYPTGQIDVAREQRLLEQHDRIILQFPFRWYSCPSLLKSWLDVVLERGWAYGPGGTALQHKELGIAVSTWSTQSDYEVTGRYGRTLAELTSPFEVTAKRVEMGYLPGFFLTGVGRVTAASLTENSARYVQHVLTSTDGRTGAGAFRRPAPALG